MIPIVCCTMASFFSAWYVSCWTACYILSRRKELIDLSPRACYGQNSKTGREYNYDFHVWDFSISLSLLSYKCSCIRINWMSLLKQSKQVKLRYVAICHPHVLCACSVHLVRHFVTSAVPNKAHGINNIYDE